MHHLLLASSPPSLPIRSDLVQSCSRTRAPVRRCRRPPHLCRTCSALVPPGSCRRSADPLAPPAVEKSGLGLASCMHLQAQLLQHLRRLPSPLFGVGVVVTCPSVCRMVGQAAVEGIGRSGDHCHLHHHLRTAAAGNWPKTREIDWQRHLTPGMLTYMEWWWNMESLD